MEEKHELFWKQGDFGYVKDVVDSMMTLCKPQAKVTTHLQVVHSGRRVKSNSCLPHDINLVGRLLLGFQVTLTLCD